MPGSLKVGRSSSERGITSCFGDTAANPYTCPHFPLPPIPEAGDWVRCGCSGRGWCGRGGGRRRGRGIGDPAACSSSTASPPAVPHPYHLSTNFSHPTIHTCQCSFQQCALPPGVAATPCGSKCPCPIFPFSVATSSPSIEAEDPPFASTAHACILLLLRQYPATGNEPQLATMARSRRAVGGSHMLPVECPVRMSEVKAARKP